MYTAKLGIFLLSPTRCLKILSNSNNKQSYSAYNRRIKQDIEFHRNSFSTGNGGIRICLKKQD